MTPLERAARALFEYEPGPYGDCVEWAIEQPFGWRDRVDEVRLVLTSIREPSEAMLNRAYNHMEANGNDPRFAWEAMIDAMLEEG
jgi:hypothetical protein